MFCKHDDIIVDKHETKMGLVQILEKIKSVKFDSLPVSLLKTKVIYVFKCKKCNRIRVVTEST